MICGLGLMCPVSLLRQIVPVALPLFFVCLFVYCTDVPSSFEGAQGTIYLEFAMRSPIQTLSIQKICLDLYKHPGTFLPSVLALSPSFFPLSIQFHLLQEADKALLHKKVKLSLETLLKQ